MSANRVPKNAADAAGMAMSDYLWDRHHGADDTDVVKGVRDSMDLYLKEREYSTQDTIRDAARDVIAEWLDQHAEEIITAIAREAKGR